MAIAATEGTRDRSANGQFDVFISYSSKDVRRAEALEDFAAFLQTQHDAYGRIIGDAKMKVE